MIVLFLFTTCDWNHGVGCFTHGIITDWWIAIPVTISISNRLLQFKHRICSLLSMTVPNFSVIMLDIRLDLSLLEVE